MIKFECNACGGSLIENGKFYLCENCGSKYLLGRDDEGQPFTYQPVEKKDIECGQMGVKASAIEVSTIAVREIKLTDTIAVDVHNEALHLDKNEIVSLVETYIQTAEWDAAQGQINRLLLSDSYCAEAQWYSLMCTRKSTDAHMFVRNWFGFSQADKTKLEGILANSSPEFARYIIDLMFESAYVDDSMCFMVLETVLPYAKNEVLYTESSLNERISKAFDKTTTKGFEQAFMFLLTHTLKKDEVDRYIHYLNKFADRCSCVASQKYYQRIIDIDPGNLEVRKKLIKADIDADTDMEKCIADFEGLLRYSKDTDAEVCWIIHYLNSDKKATLNRSKLFWNLLGYHSGVSKALEEELLKFAFILLNSSLWGEARNYFSLVLSVNSRSAEAFWGLCLARIQAKNEQDIVFKKENLIDCSEFHKSLALYRAAKNDAKVAELMAYTKKQKNSKQTLKISILATVIAVTLISIISILTIMTNKREASCNDMQILITEKGEPDDSSSYRDEVRSSFTMRVTSKKKREITKLRGEMNIYNRNGKLLDCSTLTISSEPIPSGETVDYNIVVDRTPDEESIELYYSPLEDLRITLKISDIVFEGYRSKEYPDSRLMELLPLDPQYPETDYVSTVEQTYLDAVQCYTSGEYSNAVRIFQNIWRYKDSENYIYLCYEAEEERAKAAVYAEAVALFNTERYDEAAEKFGEIYYYRDSANQIELCKEAKKRNEEAKKMEELEERYRSAQALYENKQFVDAFMKFYEIMDYKDSYDKLKAILVDVNSLAESYAAVGDYNAAYDLLSSVGYSTYSEDNSYSKLMRACHAMVFGDYKEAVYCGLVKIIVPDGVSSIRSYCCKGCTDLVEVVLPESLTSIGSSAFEGCTSLRAIHLPENLKEIGEGAFLNCKALEKLVFPAGLESIGIYGLNGLDCELYYEGTMAEWSAIEKTGPTAPILKKVLHCKDGDLMP